VREEAEVPSPSAPAQRVMLDGNALEASALRAEGECETIA
jgi:hypothetical protein